MCKETIVAHSRFCPDKCGVTEEHYETPRRDGWCAGRVRKPAGKQECVDVYRSRRCDGLLVIGTVSVAAPRRAASSFCCSLTAWRGDAYVVHLSRVSLHELRQRDFCGITGQETAYMIGPQPH